MIGRILLIKRRSRGYSLAIVRRVIVSPEVIDAARSVLSPLRICIKLGHEVNSSALKGHDFSRAANR
jgi:hypothetical protein